MMDPTPVEARCQFAAEGNFEDVYIYLSLSLSLSPCPKLRGSLHALSQAWLCDSPFGPQTWQ